MTFHNVGACDEHKPALMSAAEATVAAQMERIMARAVAEIAPPKPPTQFSWRCLLSRRHDDELVIRPFQYEGKTYEMLFHCCKRCGAEWR